MLRPLLVGLTLLVSLTLTLLPTFAQIGTLPPPNQVCQPFGGAQVAGQTYPTNGLEPDQPIWCYTQPAATTPTRAHTGNVWTDNFDNDGPAIQRLHDGDYDYRIFALDSEGRIAHGEFVNTEHWMVDLADASEFRLSGGVLLSPNASFSFVNGRLAVESDMAAGGDAMGGADAFYEMDITSAPEPTFTTDTLYGYGQFGHAGGLGCRFEMAEDGPHIVCAMYDGSGKDAGGTCMDPAGCGSGPGRVWEAQGVGVGYTAPVVEGGYPNYQIPGTGLRMSDVWRTCPANVHDLHCRDRMRMEVTKDSIHVLVNGYLVYQINGLYAVNPHNGADNRIPDSWLNSVHAYYTSWINNGIHHPTRWHWDWVGVNTPGATAAPSFCLGNTVTNPNGSVSFNTCPHNHVPGGPEVGTVSTSPTPTPSTASTSTPTPTSTPAPTVTPTSVACLARAILNGTPTDFTRPASFCSNQ